MRQLSGENYAAPSLPRTNRNQRMTLDLRIKSTDFPRRTSSPTAFPHKANHDVVKDLRNTSETSTEATESSEVIQEMSSPTRKSGTGAPERKRVVFNTTVRFVSTIGLHQYTDDEVRSTW